MNSRRFISIEGVEGAGKSTLIATLGRMLRARGHVVQLTREPGGTPAAERLRQVVLKRGAETISPMTETLLMFAARGMHVENLIRPALLRDEWVLCDRFSDATRAYQGGGRGVDRGVIDALADAVHGDLWPARTLLLDLPVARGFERMAQRAGTVDRIESEKAEFFERVRAAYLRIAREEPARVAIVDADRSSDAVAADAWRILQEQGA